MQAFVERMIEESRQLNERIEKLELFMNGNTKFQALDEKNKQLLREQSSTLPYTLENGDVINITAAPAGSTVNGNAITDGGTLEIINGNLAFVAAAN